MDEMVVMGKTVLWVRWVPRALKEMTGAMEWMVLGGKTGWLVQQEMLVQ